MASLLKDEGVFIVDKSTNLEVIDHVFLEEGVILIGVSKRKYEIWYIKYSLTMRWVSPDGEGAQESGWSGQSHERKD